MSGRCSELLRVTVEINDERVRLSGHAAQIVALVAAYGERLNAIPVGRAVVSFAHGRVKVELSESLPSLRLEPPA